MLNDFIPVVHKMYLKDHPNTITIVPLADAHYGSQEFDEVRWHKAIKRIYDDPHCFTVLVGDLIDNGLKNSLTNIFEATASPRQQKEWLAYELKCLADAGKILGAVGGNHERRSGREADSDPMFDVMVRLGIEDVYRSDICFMSIRIINDMNDRQAKTFSFAITHGSGGGQYIGSSANRVQTFASYIEGIDCIVTGHTHKPVAFPVKKLVYDSHNQVIVPKQFYVAVASSFLDYGGYPVQKMMPPAANTLTEIILTYNQKHMKEVRILQ